MFTGIIREIGKIQHVRATAGRMQYRVHAPTSASTAISGASIAVNGVCQTVVYNENGILTFDAIDETLGKTTLLYLKTGMDVHIEPALKFGDPVDGHLVYGHVDGLGTVHEIRSSPKRWDLCLKLAPSLIKYCIQGGSIAIHGVSLTIYEVSNELVSVSLIPETLARTLFPLLKSGDSLNIEVDSIGKWIEKLLPQAPHKGLDLRLKEWGY